MTPDERINALLADAGCPDAVKDIFSGDVRVESWVYVDGVRVLDVLEDE